MSVRRTWFMASIGLGILLNPFNSSMISVAIARLQSVYRLNFTDVSWIIFAFYMTSSIAQPVMGKIGDAFGRKRIFLGGLIVVCVTSLLAPLSPNFGWLIVARVFQAIGTSMIGAVGMAMVRIYIAEKQANALAVLSVFLSGASAFGPSIGGFLIHWWDWPGIFFVNIPFVVASFSLAWWMIPKDDRTENSIFIKTSLRAMLELVDGLGILLFSVGLVGILFAALSAKSLENYIVGAIGLVAMGLFVWRELRANTPFIPLRYFGQYPAIAWVNLQFVLVNILYYALFFGLPSYLQEARHLTALDTGILMLSMGVCSFLSSPIAGRWVDKSGPRPALTLSGILMVLGAVWLATIRPNSPVVSVCLALAVFGAANGFNNVGMQVALFRTTPKEIAGVSSGLFLTSRYIGTILASILLDIAFGDTFSPQKLTLFGAILAAIAFMFLLMNANRLTSHAV